jgi:signal transduction histidine kinase
VTPRADATRLLLSSWWRSARAGRAHPWLPIEQAAARANVSGGAVRDDRRQDAEHDFRQIHARFARNALGIYLAVSVVALAALTAALASDLKYQRDGTRESLAIETELRAQYLASYLGLLADEVQRIGARPEIDLLDRELGPERTLLDSYRGDRAIFNRGFALLDDHGDVMWSTPANLFRDKEPVSAASFGLLRRAVGVQIVPSESDPGVLLVASPLRRTAQFTGVLVGVIDLAAARAVDTGFGHRAGVDMALSTRDGRLLYPTSGQADPQIVAVAGANAPGGQPFLITTSSTPSLVVAGSPVPKTDFVLLSAIGSDALLGPLLRRMLSRLVVGLVLSALPLIGFSVFLRGSLRRFRLAEEEAIRSERMRSLGEAASLIAHEVRNSLNSLRLGLDVILSGESPDQGSRRAEILKSLRGEMHRLADFTTELLTFSRGVTPNVVPVDLDAFTRRVVESMRPRADDRGVRLDVNASASPLPVNADLTLIHVVLTNLVGNALDFAGSGQPPQVVVETGSSAARCFVRVIDNGPGVAASIRPRLFEPFVTGRSNGVGIGLALSRRIARAHGGDLRLADEVAGTCFELTLPGASA